MKKLVAVLLCVAMLLGTCALGEVAQFTLKNIVITADGEATDLTGFDTILTAGAEGEQGGLKLSFELNGSPVASVLLAMLGQQILLELDAGDSQERAYYVDMNVLLGLLGQQINLQTILESIGESVAGDESATAMFGGQLSGVFEGCASDGGVTQIDGVDYSVTQIEVSAEQMRAAIEALIDVLEQQGTYDTEKAEEVLNNFFSYDQEYTVSGAYYEGEGSDILDLTLDMSVSGVSGIFNGRLYAIAIDRDDGKLVQLNLTAKAADEEYALSLDFEAAKLDDISWLPADIGNAADILTLGEDLQEKLTADASALGQAILMGAVSAIYLNQAS